MYNLKRTKRVLTFKFLKILKREENDEKEARSLATE